MSPKDLLQSSMQCGLKVMALTDINNTSACMDFVRLAPDYGIRPVLGIDFRNGTDQLFIGLAKNNHGFEQLNQYLSDYLHAGKEIPRMAPILPDVAFVYPFSKYRGSRLLDNEYVGITARQINKLQFSKHKIPQAKLVILQTGTFRNKRDFNTHRLLRAIDENVLLSKQQIEHIGDQQHLLTPMLQLRQDFEKCAHILYNTERLLDECHINFQFAPDVAHKNQRTFTGSQGEDVRLLRKLCRDGLRYRYEQISPSIQARLEKELELIEQKGFVSYFLINWHIIRYALKKRYFYVGRGSGANSVVAYLLRITDVDPIELDLYFERFINLYRQNPPDFDIDFSWKDREDITQFIFREFPNTALLGTYVTFQYRAVVRELGKVFGLPKHEIDKISKGQTRFQDLDDLSQLVIRYGNCIQDFPRHLSVHAGGILISENPIHAYTATDLPPKGFPTTHFDMVVAEDIGLYKFDILSQRGLGKIKDGVDLVHRNKPKDPPIDIHDIKRFKEDFKVNQLLKQGKAIGCFYVESPAMRMLLRKLQVDNYLGLVAASSIIRPGVAKSGMMREYILRYRNPERRQRAHPVMMNIMPDTYGVMVYQEDVIKVAHYFAGLTLGEADVLRRGMSGKYRSREEFQKVQQKFFDNCIAKGYSPELTKEVWRQIESFAGYAFAKGHSASYAVESYQSLYLKAHYPLEYMVATLNNGGGFYSRELYIHEARMYGANVHAPCVNKSQVLASIKGNDIHLGFSFLKELESNTIEMIMSDRQRAGIYANFADFLERVTISVEQIAILIRVNAFRYTGQNKRELLWRAHYYLGHQPPAFVQPKLFKVKAKNHELPALKLARFENAFDQIELLGYPLCSPFNLLKKSPENKLLTTDFPRYKNRNVHILGYLVAVKNTSTAGGKRMNFGTFIDQNGHFIDTVHFPPVAKAYPFRGRAIYDIYGKVVEEFGFYSIEVGRMERLEYIEDPRFSLPTSSEKESKEGQRAQSQQ